MDINRIVVNRKAIGLWAGKSTLKYGRAGYGMG